MTDFKRNPEITTHDQQSYNFYSYSFPPCSPLSCRRPNFQQTLITTSGASTKMSTPDERHQIANQASSYKINSFSDLPTDWHLRQPGPMFTATPPPLLSPSEISRYHTQYGKLVDGLNETSKDREILYKAWQRYACLQSSDIAITDFLQCIPSS